MSGASASVFKEFLQGRFSASEAATKITTQAPEGAPEGESQVNVYDLWPLVCDAAQRRPETQGRLVQLLSAITQLPDQLEDGEPVIMHGMKFWADLPFFHWYMRDLWNYFDPPPDDPDLLIQRLEWRNLNAFAAQLTAIHCADFLLFGLWSLREALETDHRESMRTLDGSIPAAAQWIFHAGPMIYESQDEIEPSDTRGDPMGGGDLWEGKHGFCRERWDLWKERFAWVERMEDVIEETQHFAAEALTAMNRIDGASVTKQIPM